MYHVTWSIGGHVPAKRGQNLNQLMNLRGHGHENTVNTWYIFNTKKPRKKSEDIQKIMKKNMKTLVSRIRKLLTYLYYNKKKPPREA